MAGKDGLKSALAGAPAGDAPSSTASEQLGLLPAEPAAGQSAEVLTGAGDPSAARGPGRPAGSKNRRTEDWIEYYFQLGLPDPMIFLGKQLVKPVKELAKELHCKVKEAGEAQRAAAAVLMPYIHQKLPQAIELDKGVTILNLTIAQPDAPAVAKVLNLASVEVEENQEVSDSATSEVEQS